MNAGRDMLALIQRVLQDGRVLIIGGFDGSNALASSEVFDPSSGSLTTGPALAVARYSHSATTLRIQMCLPTCPWGCSPAYWCRADTASTPGSTWAGAQTRIAGMLIA